ncbi:MAG: DUF1566 domain-containing protein [Candidatus Saccharibacteria bacterium]|nr:DUF1566 domain-containing protein [Candidatus Saccharibacteria bacterium]
MGERVVPILIAVLLLGIGGAVFASLNPPAPPTDPSSQSYTLDDLCNRLQTGAAGTMVATFTEPTTGPGDTTPMCSLDELFGLLPEADQDCAESNQVTSGKTYWSLCEAGTIEAFTPVKLAATGQTTSYATGDDGDLERGETTSPRFTDNGDGTITDNLTGLVWLRHANCFGTRDWATAINDANNLASGSCSLSDGSVAGDWRLPNIYELTSLIDYSRWNPPLPSGHPFASVASGQHYWTSVSFGANNALLVGFSDGYTPIVAKTSTNYVLPVR